MYISELSAAKFRGFFTAFVQISLAGGALLSFAISSIPGFPYYYTSLVAVGLTAVFECAVVWLHETPRWLTSKGQVLRAFDTLHWLRGPGVDVEREIGSIQMSHKLPSVWQVMREFTKRSVAVPFILSLCIMFLQQAGGLNALSSYAASLFEAASVAHPRVTATYAIGLATFIVVLLSTCVIDLFGRKVLLIVSGTGMAVGTTLLGVEYYLIRPSLCSTTHNSTTLTLQGSSTDDAPCNSQYAPLAIVGVVCYSVSFAIGWGPVPWVLLSEILPLRVRGMASGIATIISWGTGALVVGCYPQFARAVQKWFAWWSFSLMNIAAVLFSVFFLRETKGRTLEDIEKYYRENCL